MTDPVIKTLRIDLINTLADKLEWRFYRRTQFNAPQLSVLVVDALVEWLRRGADENLNAYNVDSHATVWRELADLLEVNE